MAQTEMSDETRARVSSWAAARGIDVAEGAQPRLRCDAERYAGLRANRHAVLHLEDVSEIPFVSVIPGVERYQHRARVRARTGDAFAAVTPLSPGYEDYCRKVLQLGEPQIVMAEPLETPTAVARACQSGDAWDAMVRWARARGTVAIHPYMAIEPVWELAAMLDREPGIEAFVVGPTTDALWIANDKGALDELIRIVLGDGCLMRTRASRDLDRIASLMLRFADYQPFVGLKRTRCASAMGNAVFRSDELRAAGPEAVRERVGAFLARTEWDGSEDVLVVEWADTERSPSTQMWIPPHGSGAPLCEGVYDQLLEGPEKVFLGSRPSQLPTAVQRELRRVSMAVAAAFQTLGYVGRCSFDFIVMGDPRDQFSVRFTECNGRWGGTSTPMFLVDRIGWHDDGVRRPYHAQDFAHPDLVGMSFPELVERMKNDLYDPRLGTGRFVLYNVGPLENDGKFDIVSLGRTHEEAIEGITDILPRRLGL